MSPQGVSPPPGPDGLTTRTRRDRPLLVVHTGAGKGKSTAAFGLMLRGWGAGWPVAVFQFVKSAKWRTGERAAAQRLGVDWFTMGDGWSWTRRELATSAELAAEGWAQVRRLLAAQAYRMYILDEFTYPMKWGWVDTAEVIATLAARPGRQHVVITGRDAPTELLAAADLVTEMGKLRHPFDSGQRGQRGIEW